jgi:hypothetical protein
MNDFNRNTRTLIVGFVVAIMFLVPLRFVEVGQELNSVNKPQVLGEMSQQVVITPVIGEVAKLEEPYNEIETQSCIDKTKINELEQSVLSELQTNQMSLSDKLNLLDGLRTQELNVCK